VFWLTGLRYSADVIGNRICCAQLTGDPRRGNSARPVGVKPPEHGVRRPIVLFFQADLNRVPADDHW